MIKWSRIIAIPFVLLIGCKSFAEEKIGEILDTDRIKRRVEVRDYSFFSFGPTTMNNLGVSKSGQNLSYGHIWETTPYASVKLNLEGAFHFADVDASLIMGGLGANFYFTPTAMSPFAGFEFGYGAAASTADDIKNISGWAGALSFGVAMFRTSSVQLHVLTKYVQIFADNGEGQPSQANITLGVAF